MSSCVPSISKNPTRWFIAIDGIWGDRIRDSTVVTDLGDMISSEHHHTIYNEGVGTSLSKIDKLVGGATGLGFDAQVEKAYRHLIGNWVKGDEIVMLGYSRGLISCVGIPQKDLKICAEMMYKRYKHGYLEKPQHCWASIQGIKCHENVLLKALALFDTVGTLGIPKTGVLNFLNYGPGRPYMKGMQQPKCLKRVENIFHALALDEIRAPYAPTLTRLPSISSCNLEQLWLVGSHHDLGKDHPRTGELVDKPLARMVGRLASVRVVFSKGRLQERFSSYDRIITNHGAELIADPTEWVGGENVYKTYKGWIKLLGYQTRKHGRYGLRYVNTPGGSAQWTDQGTLSSNVSRNKRKGTGNTVLLSEAQLEPFEAKLQSLAIPE